MAIKFLERGAGVNKSVLREILNHRLCVVHPNIVQFREVFLTPVHLAIVMEYAAGGDMFEYVIKQKLPHHGQGLVESSARAFFQQLIIALEFCHELGIANRWTSEEPISLSTNFIEGLQQYLVYVGRCRNVSHMACLYVN